MTKSSESRINRRMQEKALRKYSAQTGKRSVDIRHELNLLKAQCYSMLVQPGRFLPMLKDMNLVDLAGRDEVLTQAKIMTADIERFKSQLESIISEIPDREFDSEDINDLMFGLRKGDEFQEWMDKFTKVVLPTADRLSVLLQNGMERRKADLAAGTIIDVVPTKE